jgi:hypothetical protein
MNAKILTLLIGLACCYPILAQSEILAMLNYETKPKLTPRREGIAIIDVDPQSPTFKKILMEIPLPSDLVAHHIFYNKTTTKAYLTSLGSIPLQVMDLKKFPYRLKTVHVPDCKVAEDMVFSEDHKTWYLTCMGTSNVIVGDAKTDKPIKTIEAAVARSKTAFISYPHGIGLADDIDRIMVTSTVIPAKRSRLLKPAAAMSCRLISYPINLPLPVLRLWKLCFCPGPIRQELTLVSCSAAPSGRRPGITAARILRSSRSTILIRITKELYWRLLSTKSTTVCS